MLPRYEPNPFLIAANLLDPAPDPFYDDPYGWVQSHIEFRLDEQGPAGYQADIMGQLPHRKRVAVRGPHGLGKTTLAAWVVLWFADTRERAGKDWKVVTTASVWRQLEKYLWPEIKKWSGRLRDVSFDPDRALFLLKLEGSFGNAFAVASDQPTAIEGAHATEILYILDEAKAIAPGTWDAVEGAFSTGGASGQNAYALAISTPGAPSGRFYDIHKRKPGYEDWWVRHVTLPEAIRSGRISEDWATARKRQWGERSAVYQQRVLGQFATQDESAVIPLAWLEAANERWHAASGDAEHVPLSQIGVDVARSGSDNTVFAFRHGSFIDELEEHSGTNLMDTTGRVLGRLITSTEAVAMVDVIGLGAGVYDRVKEQAPQRVVPYNGAERTAMRDFSGQFGFTNTRGAAYWTLREVLQPESGFALAIPPDDELTGDLTAPTWEVMSGARIKVEPKDDVMERIGRSPDKGDAVVMAVWPGEPQPGIVVEDEADTRVRISPL